MRDGALALGDPMKNDGEAPGGAAASHATTIRNAASFEILVEQAQGMTAIRWLLTGIFIFMAIFALYFAKAFFMPVLLAFLLALTLTPVVRFLRKRGVPDAVSATLLVLLSVIGIATVGYLLSGPVIDLINNAPSIGQQLAEQPGLRIMAVKAPLVAQRRAGFACELVHEPEAGVVARRGVFGARIAEPDDQFDH